MVPASPLHNLELWFSLRCRRRRSGRAETARLRGSSWPRRHGPPARSRRRDDRSVLHRRLGDHTGQFGELGVGDLATLAIGICRTMPRLSTAVATRNTVFMVFVLPNYVTDVTRQSVWKVRPCKARVDARVGRTAPDISAGCYRAVAPPAIPCPSRRTAVWCLRAVGLWTG